MIVIVIVLVVVIVVVPVFVSWAANTGISERSRGSRTVVSGSGQRVGKGSLDSS